MNIYISQGIGVIALTLMLLSYQQTDKKKFLYIQIFANLAYGVQYLLLNAISAVMMCIVATVRSLTFYKFEEEKKEIEIYQLLIFIMLSLIVGIISYSGVISIIPVFGGIAFTYGTWEKNLKTTYTIGIIISILLIVYNFFIGAYIAVIGNGFELISVILGLIKVIKNENKAES